MAQPPQQQVPPGNESELIPHADHGEHSYRGSGRLQDKVAIITGADSGIGRAVAIAFAREGADVVISYLSEDQDATETARLVKDAGRKAILIRGDIRSVDQCEKIISTTIKEFKHFEVLVNNAAFQRHYDSITDITDEEWDCTFQTNVNAMFYLCRAAVPHMKKGASIINTASINADSPNPGLLAYAATKGAVANFSGGLAQLLAEKGIRVNAVSPGPIWTPLIPSTLPPESVEKFGQQVPMRRSGQPAELAPVYVLLASDEASYISAANISVTGGKPML